MLQFPGKGRVDRILGVQPESGLDKHDDGSAAQRKARADAAIADGDIACKFAPAKASRR
jgi:hypothetical protein